MALKEKNVWAVFIEWDGQQPPTRWYRRLHDLAGWVRGEGEGFGKSAPSLARRSESNDTGGVIVQEGCIICQSESLARLLASYAYNDAGWDLEHSGGRRPSVYVSQIEMMQVKGSDPESQQYIEKINSVLGSKGRKPANAHYQTTCLECLRVYTQVVPKGRAFSCPNPSCGGVKVHSREGGAFSFCDDNSPIFELWQKTRFAGPHFEPVELSPNGKQAPDLAEIEVFSSKEYDAVLAIQSGNEVLDMAESLATHDRGLALEFLDAILVARAHYTYDQRAAARLRVISDYFSKGGSSAGLLVAESPTADLLDASLLVEHDQVVGMLFELTAKQGF